MHSFSDTVYHGVLSNLNQFVIGRHDLFETNRLTHPQAEPQHDAVQNNTRPRVVPGGGSQ